MMKISDLFELPRPIKRVIILLFDCCLIAAAFFGALVARWDDLYVIFDPAYWLVFCFVLPITLAVLIKLGLYRTMLRYMNTQVMWIILTAAMCALIATISFSFYLKIMIPRSVPFIFACLTIVLLGGSRLLIRTLLNENRLQKKELVIIYGAGAAGRQLATALTHGPEYSVLAFIDDDKNKHHNLIQGIKIQPREEIPRLVKNHKIKSLLLAIPSLTNDHRREILNYLEPIQVKVLTTPGMANLVTGEAIIDQFKEVEIDDLLGRDPVAPRPKLMKKNIHNKVVMVSGAGGSIGSEMCRQIINIKPTQLILFEANEFALYSIDKELKELMLDDVSIIPLLGNVQNEERVDFVLSSFDVDTIYHAAAYKHVPLVEQNVSEGVLNNVYGTLNLAKAAIKHKVPTFVLISTDKAVRPTNVMGASKRLAELVLQALNKQQNSTLFCMVRFGNVLGSSGSVVPLFRSQIRNGGPITITHKDITRYFMTIPEAAQLVIQAGAMATGGDVFVLDMGESVKIVDLATKMIRFSGLEVKNDKNPSGDIKLEYTGLRPGEKLFEELLIGDNVGGTSHRRIMKAQEVMMSWEELEPLLTTLKSACHRSDQLEIRLSLLEAPTAFSPNDEIGDLVWKQENSELEELLVKSLQDSKLNSTSNVS